MADERAILLRRVRVWLGVFVVGLVLSGLTALPLAWEMDLLARALGLPADADPGQLAGWRYWIALVRQGLNDTYARYPFMAYGTDWLAFAHVVIAIAFIGPWRDPVRNRWVIDFGLIACLLVVPTALAFGALRGIPPWWQAIDCSFGVLGAVPLWLARTGTARLEARGV